MTDNQPHNVFDPSDPTIKNDLNMMIYQYLLEQQLFNTADSIQGELNLKISEIALQRSQVHILKSLLCRGEWDEAHQLLAKLVPKLDIRRFLYHLNRLEYLELIETSQHQQALVFLQTHLKPFEDVAASQSHNDFKELCYLLSCKSLSDSELYRPYMHFMKHREIAAEEICEALSKYLQVSEYEDAVVSSDKDGDTVKDVGVEGWTEKKVDPPPVPGRLVSLLQQAFAHQISLQHAQCPPPPSQPGGIKGLEEKNPPLPPAMTPLGLWVPSVEVTKPPTQSAQVQGTHSTSTSQLDDGTGNTNISLRAKVHRLAEDYRPVVVPSALSAVLTAQPVGGSSNGQRRVLGDIRCFSMVTTRGDLAVDKGALDEEEAGAGGEGDLKLTVVAGTDRGSLILWQLPAKQKRASISCTDSPEGSTFDISDERFSSRLLAPSAVLELRKGDNVRVRRTYRDDDDDSSDLFPPKIRDVAVSPSTGALVWSHSDSSVRSSVLVAAALSDGSIALVCAGYRAEEQGRYTRRVGDSRDRDRDKEKDREKEKEKDREKEKEKEREKERERGDGRSRSRSRSFGPTLLPHTHDSEEAERRPMCFSQKRSYLETHEGDVLSVSFHPQGRHLASGGYDRTVAVHDVVAGTCIKQFRGHYAAVTHVSHNSLGNMVISSSKDGTVKFWDTLSGTCVKTITPTLLSSGGGYSCRKDGPPSSTPSSSASFLCSTSSTPSNAADQIGGEIVSTSISSDGRYLLVVPKLSAVRLLDLRMGTVLSRFTPNNNINNGNNGYVSNGNNGSIGNNSNNSSSNSINSVGSSSRNNSYTRSKRRNAPSTPTHKHNFGISRSKVHHQQVGFCSDDSVVVTGRGGGGDGCAVQLWSADKGRLIRSLYICCGHSRDVSTHSPSPSPLSRPTSTTQRAPSSEQRGAKDRDSSAGIAFTRGDGLADIAMTSRTEERATDMRERPRRGLEEVDREQDWFGDREKSRERERDRDRERSREGDRDSDREKDKEKGREWDSQKGVTERNRFDPQLEVIATSLVFSTACAAQCGVVAAASAAGITLWI